MIPSKIEHPYAYPSCPFTNAEFYACISALSHLSGDAPGIRVAISDYLVAYPNAFLQEKFDAVYAHATDDDLQREGEAAKNALMCTHHFKLPNRLVASQLTAGLTRLEAMKALTGEAVKIFPKPTDAELKSDNFSVRKKAAKANQIYNTYSDTYRTEPARKTLADYCQAWNDIDAARSAMPPNVAEGYTHQDEAREAIHEMVDRIDDAKLLLDRMITAGAKEAKFTLPLEFRFTLSGEDFVISVHDAAAVLKEARLAAVIIEKAAAKQDVQTWHKAQQEQSQVFEAAKHVISDMTRITTLPLGHAFQVSGIAERARVKKSWIFSPETYAEVLSLSMKLSPDNTINSFSSAFERLTKVSDAATLANVFENPEPSWTKTLAQQAAKHSESALPSH